MLSIAGDTTTWLWLHGCDVRALCDVTGISEVMLFPRAPGRFPRKERGFSRGDPATVPRRAHGENLERCRGCWPLGRLKYESSETKIEVSL
jgi:hypothetical protein